jgi:hypothetical protein
LIEQIKRDEEQERGRDDLEQPTRTRASN